MKSSTLTLTLLTTTTLTSAANFCMHTHKPEAYFIVGYYDIRSEGVIPDIPGVCGGLWDNMKRFPDCIGVGVPACYEDQGKLVWNFSNGGSCNTGMIESTWYEATRNQWGALNCQTREQKRSLRYSDREEFTEYGWITKA